MTPPELIALGAVTLVVAGVGAWRTHRTLRRRLRALVAHEAVMGHRKLRRRVENLVGRRYDTFESILEAETMHGWVYFHWTRRPGESYREHTGWALTRWGAQRKLRKTIERHTPRPTE